MLKTWPIRSAGGLGLAILLGGALAAPLDAGWGRAKEDGLDPITRPLPSDYKVNKDGSIRLRICYNWTCATREYVTFSAADVANVKSYLTQCVGENFHDRVQRLRVGVWQLQLVAQKHIPDLANDREINEYDRDVDGRLDCVDSSTNTTTYLKILQDLGQLAGFSVTNPEVRNLMDFHAVHWTAVVADKSDGKLWSVDSWFRAHGNLPFVMPLTDWKKDKKAWEAPYSKTNPYPVSIQELCPRPQQVAEPVEPPAKPTAVAGLKP